MNVLMLTSSSVHRSFMRTRPRKRSVEGGKTTDVLPIG
jgi:hypothetical protein